MNLTSFLTVILTLRVFELSSKLFEFLKEKKKSGNCELIPKS